MAAAPQEVSKDVAAPAPAPPLALKTASGKRPFVMIDGFNLGLEKGTGVATYARNLSYALRDLACDVGGGLAAVAVRPEIDHAFAARSEALYARFAAWYSASASAESTSPSIAWSGTSGSAIAFP